MPEPIVDARDNRVSSLARSRDVVREASKKNLARAAITTRDGLRSGVGRVWALRCPHLLLSSDDFAYMNANPSFGIIDFQQPRHRPGVRAMRKVVSIGNGGHFALWMDDLVH